MGEGDFEGMAVPDFIPTGSKTSRGLEHEETGHFERGMGHLLTDCSSARVCMCF